MKRTISVLFVLFLMITQFSFAAASGQDFEVRILGREDAAVRFGEHNTYTVEFQVKTNNQSAIDFIWSCEIAYDASIFELITIDGTRNLEGAGVSLIPGAAYSSIDSDKNFSSVFSPNWQPMLHAALSSDERTGYVSVQAMTIASNPVSFDDFTTLQTIRFAFRPGKSLGDVTRNSIRFIELDEMSALGGISSQIMLTNGVDIFEYGLRLGGLNTLPSPIFDVERAGTELPEDTPSPSPPPTPDGEGELGNQEEDLEEGGNYPDDTEPPDTPNATPPVSPAPDGGNEPEEGEGTSGDDSNGGEADGQTPGGADGADDAGAEAQEWLNPFNDVRESDWFFEHVRTVSTRGLFAGTAPSVFSPNSNMTRAMFAQVLANLENADLSAYTTSRFDDVADGRWYTSAIEWAADMGIVAGVGGNRFSPAANITREQMAVMLNNYITHRHIPLPSNSFPAFYDEDTVSYWALGAVRTIQAARIISGRPGNIFAPQATATRAEVAAVFSNFLSVN